MLGSKQEVGSPGRAGRQARHAAQRQAQCRLSAQGGMGCPVQARGGVVSCPTNDEPSAPPWALAYGLPVPCRTVFRQPALPWFPLLGHVLDSLAIHSRTFLPEC